MQLSQTKSFKYSTGFTLMELIVVIGMLAILFAITLVAINPAKQFADARNAERRSDVNAILNAIHQYAANNNGNLPSSITTTVTEVGNGSGQANLCSILVTAYLADLPLDPTTGTKTPTTANCTAATSYDTGYTVVKSASDNRITVAAPGAEDGATISVTR